jgi:hypothetical protein
METHVVHRGRIDAAAAGVACAGGAAPPCTGATFIKSVAELVAINKNLAGKYCLANDLDLASIANWTPIGAQANGNPIPFTGQFDGQGHVIRNLSINSTDDRLGLFGSVSGSVANLGLINAQIRGGVTAGALAGFLWGSVSNSYSTGSVASNDFAWVGGLIGAVVDSGFVTNSWSSASVSLTSSSSGGHLLIGGGLVGLSSGRITGSFATGSVSGSGNCADCLVGGLVGRNAGTIAKSFATGALTDATQLPNCGDFGGLVGSNFDYDQYGTIQQSYASGTVLAQTGAGLVGFNGSDFYLVYGFISQSYAVGPIRGKTCTGGLVGLDDGLGTIAQSYWDKNTTGQATSDGGTGMTTAQLQAALPAGFGVPPWGITKGVSYPYFFAGSPPFASMLATTVSNSRVFTFLPIGQHEPSEYLQAPAKGGALASLATVYTMIARAIGITDHVATLKGVKIDTYFWNNTTQTSSWTGPVTHYATLGTFADIGSAAPLDLSNVIGRINHRQPVILRGTYTGSKAFHYMLATLYITDASNVVTAVIANDPFTWRQVKIDPVSKHVTSPANYPLPNFTVTGYRPVTLLFPIIKPPAID